jgi:hypothetical protein
MPVVCEFINIIIPIAKIDQVYPGGFAAFKEEHSVLFLGRLWHDNFLFRDGAMNSMDAEYTVSYWTSLGLVGQEEVDGKAHWIDLCVADQFMGPTLPCSWINFDSKHGAVSHIDDTSSTIVGSGSVRNEDEGSEQTC